MEKERVLREAEERVKNHKKLTEQDHQSYLDYKAQWEEKKRQGLLRPDDYDFDGENEQQKEDRRKAEELWRCKDHSPFFLFSSAIIIIIFFTNSVPTLTCCR